MLILALACALALAPPPAPTQADVRLDIRVFDGATEVSRHVRVAVYSAGRHEQPVATAVAEPTGPGVLVPPGDYDVQVVWEQAKGANRLLWAPDLAVLRYPDEGGRHLEVLNFDPSYGALEVIVPGGLARRSPEGEGGRALWQAALRPEGGGEGAAAHTAVAGDGYVLFVVPGGRYDLEVVFNGDAPRRRTVAAIEVPAGRTRLMVIR